MNYLRLLIGFLAIVGAITVNAQSASVSGHVRFADGELRLANVMIPALGKATASNLDGEFILQDIEPGEHRLTVRAIGCVPISQTVTIRASEKLHLDFTLQPDPLLLHEAVVSATRNAVDASEAPVVVSRIHPSSIQNNQSNSVAEVLNLSPGLRSENNCQNCGFTQVRMNGLEGSYSQILINSQPIFSALAGVYGLELLPPAMIERIEVVRGGGSVLHGGNAIAGTVNIITRDPDRNSFNLSHQHGLINGEATDRSTSVNGSIVNEKRTSGLSLFGVIRQRDHWDANGDGISEITLLENQTAGFSAFHRIHPRSKFTLSGFGIAEFRRGGSHFDREPHQSSIAEQLRHRVGSLQAGWEHESADYRNSTQAYVSLQTVDRASYYGGGGRLIAPGDSLTDDDLIALNAYGQSDDLTAVAGLRHTRELTPDLRVTTGAEYINNRVDDAMPGYGRSIAQRVQTLGAYVQTEWQITKTLSTLAGIRVDHLQSNGRFGFTDTVALNAVALTVAVPRIALRYAPHERWSFRAGYAEGYRGPQAFNEDLHIETVGGSARFTVLADDLRTERSRSFTGSANYTVSTGQSQLNLLAEGFHTVLSDPFIESDPVELANGASFVTKRNGSGARVYGVNVEGNFALRRMWTLRSGFTLQAAQFDEAELLWEDEASVLPATTTTKLLRTPNAYGFAGLAYAPLTGWNAAATFIYTGSMDVAHTIDPETEYTVIKSTPSFGELNLRVGYRFKQVEGLEFGIGVINATNSFQRDFDSGPLRDAGYVYGPLRPRTFTVQVSWGI